MARSLVFSKRRRPRVWVFLLLLLLQLLCLEVSLTWALTTTTTKTMTNKLNIPNKKSNKDTPTLTQQQLVTQDKNNDDDDDPIRHTTHLFSLQWTPDERISKPVRDLWKWKDRVLGDGRDFFVPKPKTIKALQSYLLEHTPSMHSCSIISNCARFEILCSVVATDNNDDDDDSLLHEICRCLVAQQTSKNQNQQPSSMALLTQSLDWPGLVLLDVNTSPRDCGIDKTSEASNELTKHWTHIRGSREISLHLSLIAAGMASRPKRPDRPTVFRPFSSRDAHILLQLKRTKEVAVGKHPQRLLEYALRAGKASRNPQAVPALQLLKPYGTGDSSKYTTEPPLELTQQVQEAVMEQAIQPLVDDCMDSFRVERSSSVISEFRSRAEALTTNASELKWIREQLHEPTIELRTQGTRRKDTYNGVSDDDGDHETWMQAFLDEWRTELNTMRQQNETIR